VEYEHQHYRVNTASYHEHSNIRLVSVCVDKMIKVTVEFEHGGNLAF